MSTRHAMAVNFGRRQLRAVWAGNGRVRGGLKIRRTLIEDLPADINADDVQSLGAWVGGRLRAAGFPRSGAVVVIGREHVVMKRLTLPTIDTAELPDMVALAMSRELPFDLANAVVDFIPLEATGAGTTVLAVATSQAVIEQQRAIARAAGLTVSRIALRTLGAAAMFEPSPDASWALSLLEQRDNGASPCTLVIDVSNENLELGVLHRNVVDFSRAAEVPEPQDKLAIAEAIVTEARRTWMSYQSSHGGHATWMTNPEVPSEDEASKGPGSARKAGGSSLHEALLLGERRVCEYAAGPVGQLLGQPARVLDAHSHVESSSNEVDRLWPLVGVLLEESQMREVIDFANPRQAPNLGARKRQRRLIAAGIAIVACLAAGTLARQQLNALNARAEELTTAHREQLPVVARYWRDRYKLEHIDKWESTSVDWLQHAAYLTTIAPTPDRLVLNAWTGTLDCKGVKYDRSKGKWAADARVTISIDGEAKDRDTADSFRASLVQSSIYEATTPGADARAGRRMPFAFTYTLRMKNGAAPPSPAAPASDSQVVKANGAQP